MLFSSVTFLYAFLPVVLVGYALLPRQARNLWLLLTSVVFYAFGEPRWVVLLLLCALSGWCFGLLMERFRGGRGAKIALACGLILDLGLLAFFKYADFLAETVNALTGAAVPLPGIPLPLGISFFTFQAMSYLIDVYRGTARAERSLISFATFLCLFPQLVAGPIVRYTDVSAELRSRTSTWETTAEGLRRFVCGLAKKVLLANALGELCTIFRDSGDKSVAFYWLYAAAFSLQIYFDFSGYSDMAIGLGRIMGFRFPENFNYPYISASITEFWRRWHMTLSGWFRDYVYIPLGGSRVSRGRWALNLAAVWLLTGLWHGAAWNFVLWGGLYGVLLVLEKFWLGGLISKLGPVVPRLYVALVTMLGFVLFNADGLSGVRADLSGLFGAGGLPLWSGETGYYFSSYAILLVLALAGATPWPRRLYQRLEHCRGTAVVEPVVLTAVLVLCTAALVDGSFNPFLYFRF